MLRATPDNDSMSVKIGILVVKCLSIRKPIKVNNRMIITIWKAIPEYLI